MKKLVGILAFLIVTITTNAAKYYVSALGSDLNNGTSTATPWQTINKVNTFTFAAGDTIFFKRGDTFSGPLIVSTSGTSGVARVVYSAYGTGAKPIITGFTTQTTWTATTPGVYQTTIANGLSTSLWVVTMNGAIQRMGRFPNADSVNGGYLTATAVVNTAPLTITSTGLPTTINWTGATAIVKKNDFILDACAVTAQTTTTITYTNPPAGQIPTVVDNVYGAKVGYGFFIQNDIRTLDRVGEWFYNPTTKVFSMFFGSTLPSAYTIKISRVDTLINCGGQNGRPARNYLAFENLAIEGGNDFGIFAKDNNTISVTNCDFNANRDGVNFWAVPNQIVQYCTFTNTLNNATQLRNRSAGPTTIRKNTVIKCAMLAGMGRSGDGYYNGIRTDGDNAVIEYNRLDSIGYNGIQFGNTNQTIRYNFVTNFCMTKEDGGGIYIYNTTQTYTNRNITDNIVLNAIGNATGTTHQTLSNTRCIYLDGTSSNINVSNNVAAYSPSDLMLMNSNQNVRVTNNIFYGALYGITLFKYGGAFQRLANLRISSNVILPTIQNIQYRNQDNPVTVSMTSDIRAVGTFDSNYYRSNIRGALKVAQGDGTSYKDYAPFSLSAWQTLLGSPNELNSKILDTVTDYTLIGLVGANKTPNSTFEANITGVTKTGTGGTISWDNTSKITGVGSVKIVVSPLDSTVGKGSGTVGNTTVYENVGSVVSGRNYIGRFTTLGTSAYGYAAVFLRNSTGTVISNVVYVYFGATKQSHQVNLACTSSTTGYFAITFSHTQTPLYYDDYYFYEASVTTRSLSAVVNLQYNADSVAKTIPLTGTWKDMKTGTVYTGSITLQPYTGVLLIVQPNPTTKTALLYLKNNFYNINTTNIVLYPNPVQNYLHIAINTPTNNRGVLSIINMQGSTLYKQKIKLSLGNNIFIVSAADLTTQEYYVSVKLINKTLIDKFIKA